MIVRRFLSWMKIAPAAARAEGASALARAFLYSDLPPTERHEAEAALTLLIEDASDTVRCAVAEALAGAADAPVHLLAGLAAQGGEAAAIVLARSPLIGDAELVDFFALGDARCRAAIAARPAVSAGLAAAIGEVGDLEAVLALLRNPGAEIAEASLLRALERFGDEPSIRESVLAREPVSAGVRQAVMVALSRALTGFVRERNWLAEDRCRRLAREAEEAGTLTIAARSGAECGRYVARLRAEGRITPGFILRALVAGHPGVVEAILADLTDRPLARVAGALREPRSPLMPPLLRKAGLPDWMAPLFRLAIEVRAALPAPVDEAERIILSRRVVERVIAGLATLREPAPAPLLVLLRRFQGELAREEARLFTDAIAELERIDAAREEEAREAPVRLPHTLDLFAVGARAA
jgi:uncharacterized protein (DUF2336 family)